MKLCLTESFVEDVDKVAAVRAWGAGAAAATNPALVPLVTVFVPSVGKENCMLPVNAVLTVFVPSVGRR